MGSLNVALEAHGADELSALAGPVLLVANHGSELDAGLVRDSLPADRRRGLRVAEQAAQVEAGVKRGRWVLYFPEEEVSADGLVHGFNPRLGAIAEASAVTVVPIGIRGSYAAQPPGRTFVTSVRPRVSVRFGLPLTWRPPKKTEPGDDGGYLAFTERVRGAVEALIAEDATSWWQTLRSTGSRSELAGTATWRRIWEQAEEPVEGGGSRRAGIWHR